MAEIEPVAELNEGFSEPGVAPRPWSDVVDVLTRPEMFWLSTVRRDGRPHVTPLPAIWLHGSLHFCVGPDEQKAKNLEHDARCVLTTGTNRLRSGLDVVVEGLAARVTGRERIRELAALWDERLDWPFEPTEDGFRGADGRFALVFGVAPTKILAFGKAPYSQTRYRFPIVTSGTK
ncbi:pyridoxamine 5'-phosphate oxidase family protein [Actinomadura rayongensis]|uniref:Pyridoxamine 5'-phosphate oxidase family protein n=1 Tax=Actinomadura rayongensis TaxID=1429076 RepID=A0A6I4WEI1_9ACTN|nr:pyridoxamine 5'-phosphate oxidase family protein [Actinomadura rayongensis]MXQ65394.1 pyridoxamine 5'-phosphate oxidase family protein [Actinomadura rayongensis]